MPAGRELGTAFSHKSGPDVRTGKAPPGRWTLDLQAAVLRFGFGVGFARSLARGGAPAKDCAETSPDALRGSPHKTRTSLQMDKPADPEQRVPSSVGGKEAARDRESNSNQPACGPRTPSQTWSLRPGRNEEAQRWLRHPGAPRSDRNSRWQIRETPRGVRGDSTPAGESQPTHLFCAQSAHRARHLPVLRVPQGTRSKS